VGFAFTTTRRVMPTIWRSLTGHQLDRREQRSPSPREWDLSGPGVSADQRRVGADAKGCVCCRWLAGGLCPSHGRTQHLLTRLVAMNLHITGLSHKTAPCELREKLAIEISDAARAGGFAEAGPPKR